MIQKDEKRKKKRKKIEQHGAIWPDFNQVMNKECIFPKQIAYKNSNFWK